ncbi:hypothetical protein ACIQNU_37045 [Streptomyces sp. NPDC091292]|uniref:hypothetical protein n=1 Tax=Streptomyces sp. NPDC091292 TaxID=3365991 RepID=UPI003815FD1F
MSFGQGGPEWGPGASGGRPPRWGSGPGAGGTPDWAALADASAARARRRKMLFIGGGALATVAVAAAVAVVVVSANSGDQASNKPSDQLPTAADIPSDTTEPGPSFAETSAPPPLDPKEFISSADKDKAPLSPDTLYPGTKLTMGDAVYKKGETGSSPSCPDIARGDLSKVLKSNGCTRMIRATYTKDGIAVTVGVALFDTEAKATKAKTQADKGNVISLPGSGVPTFCRTSICRSTANSYGRYAYFTIAGFTNGKSVTEKDSSVFKTGDDIAEFTFRQIIRRGEAQASAAANAP